MCLPLGFCAAKPAGFPAEFYYRPRWEDSQGLSVGRPRSLDSDGFLTHNGLTQNGDAMIRTFVCSLFAAACCVASLAAQAPGAGGGKGKGKAAGPPKIQVLIITGQNPHPWRDTTPVMRKALEDTRKFEVRVTEEFRGAGPEALANYDLAV